jgi:hypothetical protein
MNGSGFYLQSLHACINNYQMCTKMLNAVSCLSHLGTCVARLVLKLCVTLLCPVGLQYTNIESFTLLQKSMEVQMRTQERKHSMETMKVIVACLHQEHSTVRSCYFCCARGSCECKFTACCGASGMSSKGFC